MQTFKQTYLCLSAQTYRIEQEDKNGNKTGEIIEGITIRYIPTSDLTPQEDLQAADRGQISRGIKAAKMNLPIEKASQLNIFPALYEVEIEMTVVQDKLQARAKNIVFASEVKLTSVKNAS
jgi:hypothetical protein